MKLYKYIYIYELCRDNQRKNNICINIVVTKLFVPPAGLPNQGIMKKAWLSTRKNF